MPKKMSEAGIGRRLRFRDLQVFSTVVQCGGMAKAAAELGVTQPSVSETIAELERIFAVRLFDRNPQGVVPTIYGRALLKRGMAAYDELKQGIRDIEFLTDPTKGEVRIGCPESIASAILPAMVQSFLPRLSGNRARHRRDAYCDAGTAGPPCAKTGCRPGAAGETPGGRSLR